MIRAQQTRINSKKVYTLLRKVIDPELKIDIVSLGLVYDVIVKSVNNLSGELPFVYILLTLTTPGCPLAGMFDQLIKDALIELPNFDPKTQVEVELTFDPPWVPDMMSEEAKAELGFD